MSDVRSMSAGPQKDFTPSNFFVFRTPLLPFAELLKWSEELHTAKNLEDHARFDEAYAKDCALLRERLYKIVARPEVRDAIFVASPNVIERFSFWTDDAEQERGRKIEHVLIRYFSRMTGRATPFGLFAGCSVGNVSKQTQLTIEGRDKYQRHTRLDMDYLYALVEAIRREAALVNALNFYPNSSLYRAAARLRYVESRLKDKTRSYHLVAVEDADYLSATLERARDGATIERLSSALVDEEISLDEARYYILQLVESQILVPEIALCVSGAEPINPLIGQLSAHTETREIAATLEHTRARLASIDRAGLGAEPDTYLELARVLETLPAKVERSRLFQVDMVKPAPTATLGAAVLDEMMRGVHLLHRLFSRTDDALKQFREAFVARYEEREVPLVEALDEEVGVGFGASEETSPLLKDLLFPSEIENKSLENERRHEMLLRKLSEALQSGAHEIHLAPKDLEATSNERALQLPDAFAATARLAAASQAALDEGRFQLLIESISGPSGANLMGRFCHADESLYENVLSHLRDEESLRAEAIFAEIVHLPEGRLGNVIARPALREFEITYLGRSGASAERQIPITDLHVAVQRGRITLRSARFNTEVIPRLTNAHNYAWNSLGIYKFLCMLSQQGVTGGLFWDWGALSSAPFLPRVTAERLVLSLASWRIHKEELRALNETRGAVARYRAVQRLRDERELPRIVMLADGDNQLPVDLDNALSVESFVQLIREREVAILKEMFPAPDQLCAHGPEGAFVHELVVPFVKKRDEGGGMRDEVKKEGREQMKSLLPSAYCLLPSSVHSSLIPPPPSLRRFPPGSEWLYAKLYAGTATADALLREVVRPLIDSLMQAGAVDGWFFIRYGDPEWHLRLRFHGRPEKLQREVWRALNAALQRALDDGSIWRVQFDTYERETERYGGAHGVLLAERIFHADSDAALEMIEMLEPGDAGADERWRLTLYGIDLLLADLGFDLEAKWLVMKSARDAFAQEFRADENLWSQLRERIRAERRSLTELLHSDVESEHPLAPGLEVLRRRSARLAPVIAELKACAQAGQLTTTLQELAQSYMHMHANRMLRSAQRQQELVIYDLLTRLYESERARAIGVQGKLQDEEAV